MKFIEHFINSNPLRGAVRGTAQPKLTQASLNELKIPIAPTAEQQRIVAAIEEQFSRLDAGEAALRRVRLNLKRMRAAVLQAAVTGALRPLYGNDIAGPSSWQQCELGDVLEDMHAGKSFKCEERPARDDEWGVIKVSAMTWGEFRQTENKTVMPGRNVDPRMEIKQGDLLVSRANTVDYVGAVVLVDACRPRLLLSDKSLRLKPKKAIMPEWLVIMLRSRVARRYIEEVATGTSDSMRNISQPKLKALRIVLPPPEDQETLSKEVARQLSLVAAIERAVDAEVRKGSGLRSSILAAAFTGQLVHQDSREESASILLERLVAERASSNGHKPSLNHTRRTKATT